MFTGCGSGINFQPVESNSCTLKVEAFIWNWNLRFCNAKQNQWIISVRTGPIIYLIALTQNQLIIPPLAN